MRTSLTLTILALLALCTVSAHGGDAGLVGYWTFDDKPQITTTSVLGSRLEAIDARTILVLSAAEGQPARLEKLDNAADASDSGNQGDVRGPTVVPGIRGNALEFNGHDSFVEVPDSPSLRVSGAVTIEMWVRPDDFEHGSLIAKDFTYGGPSWCQMYFFGGKRCLQVSVNNDGGPTVNTHALFEPGRWRHVAMTYDGSSRTRIYVDGVLDCEDTTTYTGPIPVSGESLKLGKRPDGLPFQGALDEVRISKRELPADEILARYRSTKPDRPPARRPGAPEEDKTSVADAGLPAPGGVKISEDNAQQRKLTCTWQQIELHVPSDLLNLALQREGATYSASSETEGPITLGAEPDRNARMSAIGTHWQDKTPEQYPDSLIVRFPQPREIDCIVLRTYGEHVRGRNKEGIRDYRLECCTASGDSLIVAAVRNNTKEYMVHHFPPLAATEVRLVVTAANRSNEIGWGSRDVSRLQDIEIYRLGSVPAFATQTKSRAVTIQKAVAGRVAIFNDEVPMPEGTASSPERLAQVLRQAGFGVTFLDFDLLTNTSVLDRDNFDLFIQPYGCSFPLGTPLYSFLEAGGHLVTLGGQAFTNALVRSADGQLRSTGYDPGIITTPAKMVQLDWYSPLREQLGIFAGPNQRLVNVTSARAPSGQHTVNPRIRIDQPLAGYPSTGLVGQDVPIEEEDRYVREGKEMVYILDARKGAKSVGTMHRLDANSDYFMFNKPCARWLPLLETYDRYDRPRGSAGAMLLNHDGLYRGSIWSCFGVTNCDLFGADSSATSKALVDIVRFSLRGTFLHGLRSGLDCYRQGEKADARAFVENFGPADRKGQVSFLFLPLHSDEVVFRQDRDVTIPRGKSTLVEATWTPAKFDLDFYRVRCVLSLDNQPADEMESGFVVWNEASMQGESAVHLDYKDNYFRDGRRPLFVTGTRTCDMHRCGQHGHDPLSRQRQYQAIQDFGMSAVSPVFFQMYLPGFAWGKPLPELVPEAMLRQMDALAQLCQRHKLIFAPCIFFENRHDCLKPEGMDLSAKIAKLLGDRYCRVPGLLFYIWDDGVSFDATRADQFLEFSRRCTEAFASNPAGRKYLTLAEIYQSQNMGTRRTFEHLTIGHYVFPTYNQMVPIDRLPEARLADVRAAGKSQGCGEFDLWAGGTWGNDFEHRFYLGYPHVYFGLGYSWIVNWQWQDEDSMIFPWGIVYPCDRIPKGPAYTYRNVSWFLRSFRPKYVQPDLMLVLPNAYWEKNKPPREQQDALPEDNAAPAEIDTQLLAYLKTIMAQGHINLGVVDEHDLPKLSPTTKALIYPAAMCPDAKTYTWLREFVRGGGHLYVTDDISYSPDESMRHPERLKELAGIEPASPLAETKVPAVLAHAGRETAIRPVAPYGDWTEPYQGRVGLSLRAAGAETLANDDDGRPVVVRHKLGSGLVVFSADLSANAPGTLIDAFLHDAGVRRVPTEPASPDKVRVFHVPTEDGNVYGVTSAAGAQDVTLTALSQPVTLRITRSPMAIAGVDARGRLTACETDGLLVVGNRKVIESTVSVMMLTLDGKPIEESSAVVLLPQPETPGDFTCRLGQNIDLLEIGDVQDGTWRRREQSPVRASDGFKFHIDNDQSLSVVLLTCRADRDKYVKRLTRFLQGYLE